MNNDVIEGLKKRYSHIHPLIFQRSLERSLSNGDLFDILETFPETYPVIWNEKKRCWAYTPDLYLLKNFE